MIVSAMCHVLQRLGDLLTSSSVINHGEALVQLCTWSSTRGQKSQYCPELRHPDKWIALSVLSHLWRKQASVALYLDGYAPNCIHLTKVAVNRESLRPFAKKSLHGPSNINQAYMPCVYEIVQSAMSRHVILHLLSPHAGGDRRRSSLQGSSHVQGRFYGR